MILLVAGMQLAAAEITGTINWDQSQGLSSAQYNCSDANAPVSEDGYLHWVFLGATNVTDAQIQVDGDTPVDYQSKQGNNMDFYTVPYYEFDTLDDMTVTVTYKLPDGTTLDSNAKITLSHYCPGDPGIPEFPTIALPIAAIIGLAFIFQRRKE
ncbi:PEF-CTERM sorting domain-containing protein [Methanolobus vulcani]|uniref:PEF-CTERM sorting domain-containing protein n=1 Tax=Methanolobus vulcani TaxID=38026 RepID=UPI001E61564A|nr:PEF-CTERM sorting domain-containing protein [Methanolobus vulcani]